MGNDNYCYEVLDRDWDVLYAEVESIARSWGYDVQEEDQYYGMYWDATNAFIEKLEDYVRTARELEED